MCEEVNAVEEYIYMFKYYSHISSFANESMNEPRILILSFPIFLRLRVCLVKSFQLLSSV